MVQKPAAEKKEPYRRNRMTLAQSHLLEIEFQRDPNWTNARVKAIAERMQLGRVKVYKWGWDRKKKENRLTITATADSNNINDRPQPEI